MEILKNLMKYVVIYLDCILDIVLKPVKINKRRYFKKLVLPTKNKGG